MKKVKINNIPPSTTWKTKAKNIKLFKPNQSPEDTSMAEDAIVHAMVPQEAVSSALIWRHFMQ